MEEAIALLRSSLLEVILPAVAVAAATAGLLTLIARRFKSPTGLQVWIAPLAVIAGMLAGNFYRRDFPYWSLENDRASLLPATIAVLFIGAIAEMLRPTGRPWISAIIHIAGALLGAFWLTPTDLLISRWLGITIAFVVVRSTFFALARVWDAGTGRCGLALLSAIWGGAIAVTMLAFVHATSFFDLATIFSASLFGAGIVGAMAQTPRNAAYAGAALFLPFLVFLGEHSSYTLIPIESFLLIALAPSLALWALPELVGMLTCYGYCEAGRSGSAKEKYGYAALAILLLAIPLAIGVTLAAIYGSAPME